MWMALTNAANAAANSGKDESSLELFFGLMAAGALVTSLLWLYFKVQRRPAPQPEAEPGPEN